MLNQELVNQIFRVEKEKNKLVLIDTKGVNRGTFGINSTTRKKAFDLGNALKVVQGNSGKIQFRQTPIDEYKNLVSVIDTSENIVSEPIDKNTEVKDFIHNKSLGLKPESLVMKDLKWKYLIRSAVRAKNIMMVGPSGCGKTMAAKALVKSLNRPDFYFNLGATQDPRATLVGNTHFNNDSGTFFSQSSFVKAITTENAVILLDELSRAHPDAWNILMTVLDQGQRYLRLDEAEGSPIVKVANGVTFIATANIGSEYTSTRVIDRAILDRFVTIEMDVLNDEQEFGLLKYMFPQVEDADIKAVSEIAHHTRELFRGDSGKLSSMISTRASVETVELIFDGFTLLEAAEISMLPFFSEDGGVESERTYVTQLIQKYIPNDSPDELFESVTDEIDVDEKTW